MANSPPPDAKYQSSYFFTKHFRIGHSRLATLALKGLIGFKTQEAEWAPCLFNVDDVRKYLAKRKLVPRVSPPQLAVAAGN